MYKICMKRVIFLNHDKGHDYDQTKLIQNWLKNVQILPDFSKFWNRYLNSKKFDLLPNRSVFKIGPELSFEFTT